MVKLKIIIVVVHFFFIIFIIVNIINIIINKFVKNIITIKEKP
jgi:hypothetical protein